MEVEDSRGRFRGRCFNQKCRSQREVRVPIGGPREKNFHRGSQYRRRRRPQVHHLQGLHIIGRVFRITDLP